MDWQSVLKYNPNHDPKNGRFTFAGQGGAANPDSTFERALIRVSEDQLRRAVDSYEDAQEQRGLIAEKYQGKSAYAIVKALQDAYPHLSFPRMESMHPFALREVATQIDRMATLHPDAFAALDTIGMQETAVSTFSAIGNHSKAWAVMQHGHMRFNPRYFDMSGDLITDGKNRDDLLTSPVTRAGSLIMEMREAEEVGYHPVGNDTVGSIFVHEFGHHLQAFEQDELAYRGKKSPRNGKLLTQRLMQDLGGTTVSTYANANANEWFAETFAATYSYDKPKELRETGRTDIKSVRAIFDHYFLDYGTFARGQPRTKKEDLAQADLDRGGRLPPTQGPKRKFKRMFRYSGVPVYAQKYDPAQPRDEWGRWTTNAANPWSHPLRHDLLYSERASSPKNAGFVGPPKAGDPYRNPQYESVPRWYLPKDHPAYSDKFPPPAPIVDKQGIGSHLKEETQNEDGSWNVPQPGESFLVYRIDSGRNDSLRGVNAANASGVVGFFDDMHDPEQPDRGYKLGTHLSLYRVTLAKPFGEYETIRDRVTYGKPTVGRSAGKDKYNPSVWYSFPTEADSHQSERIASVPMTSFPKHGFTPEAVREAFRKHLSGRIQKANPYHDPKNGRFTTKANAFMDEWWAGSQPHPFDDRQRLRRNVGVEMSPWQGMDQVHMASIISYGSKGKGEASELMREITQMADEHGIAIDLNAKPIPDAGAKGKGLTKAQLIKWYQRHGFRQSPGYGDPSYLTRFPTKAVSTTKALQTSARTSDQAHPLANQFATILKYNHFHDERGRFASARNSVAFMTRLRDPDTSWDQKEKLLNLMSLRSVDKVLDPLMREIEQLESKARDLSGAEFQEVWAEIIGRAAVKTQILDYYAKREVREEVAANTAKATFFHGSREAALQDILANGIKSRPAKRNHDEGYYYQGDRGRSVYMTNNEDTAKNWAMQAATSVASGNPVIFKLRIPKEERVAIVQDEFFKTSTVNYRIPRDIPPEWIVAYATHDRDLTTTWHKNPGHVRKEEDGIYYHVVVVQEPERAQKFNPFHDAKGRFTTAQNAKQQEGHDELPTVEAMNQAMQLVGMDQFERAVMEHLESIGRPVMGAEQAYEIERVARRIVAAHRGAVKKCDFTMPLQYFMEIGDAYRAFKFDESKHPREPAGSPKGGQFAAWRQGTGMYLDDRDTANKVWRYGGDHSAVPEAVATRLKAMAIPPASINVHLNPDPTEPLQATWTARNGKLQYRYSAEAMGNNAAEKFSRLKDFNAAMPLLRRRSHDDMLKPGPQADRDTAAVVRLMSKTGFRVGGENEFETKKGKAYGASTLLDRHVVVTGNKLTFSFPGKHAVMQNHVLDDMLLAQYVRNRKRNTTKDERLFVTNEGRVNKYLKDVTGQPFSAKDFRTWHGTHKALETLKQIGEPTTEAEYRKARVHVGDVVSKHLGNTRTVALGSYIDPTVWGRWAGKEKAKRKKP